MYEAIKYQIMNFAKTYQNVGNCKQLTVTKRTNMLLYITNNIKNQS